ncbi:glycerophosphodiester phosphodiesterase family protein [Microbulbifer hydrolyticus]|uniref:Glycerophosphodiester phosphodiesterase n=1 Tax=Microbulbifer hydrolyticus TaxID=48074 RepID=A0A6P1TGY4_9GAMM|nr:glycerophosphodiester phosphodiesterase family protein [Microbulbifer hydrolyticus]MBB5211931.1 glycerophosphoryl diester phosphodiesterase [Microbulbifer hydrolyticus]QHQ40489.1 glycerophosphodiester phosphodiesterase [Microbulbifer hydrolyticus]
MRKYLMLGITAFVIAIYLTNASWLAEKRSGKPTLISHRGVYQTYDRKNLGRDDCTAIRVYEPEHEYLENTLASMQAAFDYGADIVEIDVHPTTDGEFAVFHDWTLDCRTEGKGTTRDHPMSYLKTLDIGYGYTPDGGNTFPFRGKGIGLMPTLEEVYRTFPGKRFLINIKSGRPKEAVQLDKYLRQRQLPPSGPLMVYGSERVMEKMRELRPDVWSFSRESVKNCSYRYLLLGWTGYVPDACRNGAVVAPNTWQWALWGWPDRFMQRMDDAGALVMELDFAGRGRGMHGIYKPHDLDFLPGDYRGALWVEKIEVIGPLAKTKFGTEK